MLTVFLLLLACDMNPPPKAPPRKPKPPPSTPKVHSRSDAATDDTGETLSHSDLLRDVRFVPEKPHAFEDLNVVVELKPTPGKRVDVDYTWEINGRVRLSARTNTLSHQSFKKGDQIRVRLTIDGGGPVAEVAGPKVTIANTPPRILTKPNTLSRLDGFRIRAQDPDGGSVQFRLEGGPPGLSVSQSTGVFLYKPANDAEGGRYNLKVIVSDEDKGESEWGIGIDIKGGSQSKSEIARREAALEAARAEKEDKNSKRRR